MRGELAIIAFLTHSFGEHTTLRYQTIKCIVPRSDHALTALDCNCNRRIMLRLRPIVRNSIDSRRWRTDSSASTRPAFSSNVSRHADSDRPCSVSTSRTPRPASTLANRQMIIPKSKVRAQYANQTAHDHIEPMVEELEVPRGGYVNGRANGD
jgi:hypothetical protein